MHSFEASRPDREKERESDARVIAFRQFLQRKDPSNAFAKTPQCDKLLFNFNIASPMKNGGGNF